MNNYAIFIPTYKRPDRVYTVKALRDAKYTGQIYLIVGDDDPCVQQYIDIYGDDVIIFSKNDYIEKVDTLDNFKKKNCVVYVRNAMFEIAKQLGLDYFLVLDDDYSGFVFRRPFGEILKTFKVKNIQGIIDESVKYLEKTEKLDCFAWCQNGDFIGGASSFDKINGKRKIMNGFVFRTDRPIRFTGSINEDLNASVYEGQRGKCFFTINDIAIQQIITQKNKGGLTDIYLEVGTYVKSFYSVIVAPNCVKVSAMGSNDLRLHHLVNWNLCCPKIISDVHKK